MTALGFLRRIEADGECGSPLTGSLFADSSNGRFVPVIAGGVLARFDVVGAGRCVRERGAMGDEVGCPLCAVALFKDAAVLRAAGVKKLCVVVDVFCGLVGGGNGAVSDPSSRYTCD